MADESVVGLVSEITEFNDMSEFMKDPDLDRALEEVIKLIMNPEVAALKAPILIVRLQAISAKMGMLASHYTTLAKGSAGTPNNNKKNIYYSARENLDKLVDALKYLVRYN